ncbi:MAG: FAD-binding oxidoreductase [Methylothermaceae bacterium]|nr:FAD-binding oxidoreductase [Methylothermaceae bacterium]
MTYDVLILGQGLVGSLLAWRLIRAGMTVLVVDGGGNNASRTAAGLVTPVTGKRWVTTVGVDTALPEARGVYKDLAQDLTCRVWYEHPILRLYRNQSERDQVRKRRREADYLPYLGEEIAPGTAGWDLADDYGGCWLREAAHLDTEALLDRLRDWLQARGAYLARRMDYATLAMSQSGIQWNDQHADRVIFCEGWRVVDNPWFGALPWQPSQGEILTLESRMPLPSFPVNAGCWMLPLGKGRFRVGATYRWQPLTEDVSESARRRLLAGLNALFRKPLQAQVIAQRAGIRPNTLDHQPVVGRHPRHPRLLLCNGFGSKGSLLAPWATRCLTEHLLSEAPLPAFIDLRRYHARLD